jgi:hypothetical protein
VHWGTFNLAMHDWDEPAEELLRLAPRAPLLMPQLGEAVEPSRAGGVAAWWRKAVKELAPGQRAAPEPQLDPNVPIAWPLD